MKKQHYQWVLLSLGLAVSVGCTVPFLVNTRDAAGGANGGSVITDPNAVASSLPIFLPQPGSSTPPVILSPSSGPFQPVASGNPPIIGGLPAPTATPFLSNIAPNIDNQIIANPLPVLQASGGLTSTQPIVPSIIRGRVLGYNPSSGNYQVLSNAQVRIDDNLSLTTDANGFYETTQEFDKAVSISAASPNYIGSTVTDVPPGINRDIHLNTLDSRMPYRQDTFVVNGSVTNLAQNGKRPLIVFTDGIQSVSNAAHPEVSTGRFSMNVRLPGNRSSTSGTLFGSVSEQVGKLSVITQYGYSPNVQVPVPPPQPVPTATPDLSGEGATVPLKPTDMLLSFDHLVSPEAFGEISVNFTAPAGSDLQGAVMHVYMNLPDGGKVLVAKYNDNTSTTINQRIRVPRIANTSFTLVAHSGSALKGSDVVVPNIQLGSTITRSFLPPPNFTQIGSETDFSDPRKTHFQTSDLTPRISWSSQSEINSYQLDLQADIPTRFRWEAYTLGTQLDYPDFGTDHPLSLKEGQTYRLQLMASDFDIGTFNILSQQGERWRAPGRFETLHGKMASGGFGIQLRNPTLNNFAQGYRIGYSTISFVTD
ncbi:MAG: hypothetical protein IGS03_04130 [Candidatus Sericytochromatia bacterium]|nr:hypothetical protein [Candidatus Sericytochromatia bacterium]